MGRGGAVQRNARLRSGRRAKPFAISASLRREGQLASGGRHPRTRADVHSKHPQATRKRQRRGLVEMPFSVRVIRVCLWLTLLTVAAHAQPAALTITTEPNAIVWIDEIRRGTTDASGKLILTKLSPGRHTVRVRANNFKEATAALLPGRRTL